MYAGRRRRKPVPRTAKLPPSEGVKANPSKRHRERLNSELECLASLLPFPSEVISSLDKLSILRLTVSYLRTQSFFQVTQKSHCAKEWSASHSHDGNRSWRCTGRIVPEGKLLLQALNGFVLVVTWEGLIFYSSHTIQDYLGFHQTDVLHQSVFELIHTEDQPEFRRNLHWRPTSVPKPESDQAGPGKTTSSPFGGSDRAEELPPENSALLERSFVCRFRCLLDNSSGFRALSLQGRLKPLHGQNHRTEDGCPAPRQLALFAISTPLQPPSILEIRAKTLTFRTKHKLDFTPVACDAKGKLVLGYTEAELRMRGTGYQFIHTADMLYCAENHIRMMRTGESGLTVFRLLTKENRWRWVQSSARLVYRNGKPDYILATQRPLADEEVEHLQKRPIRCPLTLATGEALLYQAAHPDAGFPDPLQNQGKTPKFKKSPKRERNQLDLPVPNSLVGATMPQHAAVYVTHTAVTPELSFGSGIFHRIEDPFVARLAGDLQGGSSKIISSENELKELVDWNQGTALLDTLDSLSLDYDENCSNNELLGALENLGLNAEELELLLLDEWRVKGGENPGSSPSLRDTLTNREILSSVHSSLLNKKEDKQVGDPPASLKTRSLLRPSQEPEVNDSHTAHQYPLSLAQEPQPNQSVQILCLPNSMQCHGISQKQPGHLPGEPGQSQSVTNERHNQDSCESWRQRSATSQDMADHFTQSIAELQQQWVPSNSLGLLSPPFPHQYLENPCQPKESQQQLENRLRSQHGGSHSLFQHQLPNQLNVQLQQYGHGSSESGTLPQTNTDQNLLMNSTQSRDSPSQQILGGNLWPNCASRIQHPTQTKLLSQAGNSPRLQVYSRNAQRNSRKSQAQVNSLDNMDIGKSHGIGAETDPDQRCLPPCKCHPIPLKPSTSISSEAMFPFQKFTSDHFINGDGYQETLTGNIGGLTNRPVESWGDLLLPSGQLTDTTERHSSPEMAPQPSSSFNGGFYF